MEAVSTQDIIYWDTKTRIPAHSNLICEEPLSIRVQGNPYSVVMRTPGEELPHVAGFCLGEGIVDIPEDIQSLAFCDGSDTNVVTVTLEESRRKAIPDLLDRRQYISQTSCGLCGKELVKDLYQQIRPVTDDVIIDPKAALKSVEKLSVHQPIRNQTRGAHGAAIFTVDFKLLSMAEDVGRHNALDKAVGKLFLDHRLEEAAVVVMSSRISYELVQKAARARISIILALSKPTVLAVDLASELDMTLASLSEKKTGLEIYCGEKRLP